MVAMRNKTITVSKHHSGMFLAGMMEHASVEVLVKARCLLLLPMLLCSYASADVFNEQSLKTLFNSSSERKAINATRRGGSGFVSGPASVELKGVVKRSDGKSVVWINRKNTMGNTMIDGVKVYPNAINKNNKVPIRVDGRMVYVKPGESWSEETGVTEDNY